MRSLARAKRVRWQLRERMNQRLTSAVHESSLHGMVSQSAVIVRMVPQLLLPAVPRMDGGICCCTGPIMGNLPARATGRGLLRLVRVGPVRM